MKMDTDLIVLRNRSASTNWWARSKRRSPASSQVPEQSAKAGIICFDDGFQFGPVPRRGVVSLREGHRGLELRPRLRV
jgi:hypothetical protein